MYEVLTFWLCNVDHMLLGVNFVVMENVICCSFNPTIIQKEICLDKNKSFFNWPLNFTMTFIIIAQKNGFLRK
jgi:hypothetical protein